MESHPQNPEFKNNPENFHPCRQRVNSFTADYFPLGTGIKVGLSDDLYAIFGV